MRLIDDVIFYQLWLGVFQFHGSKMVIFLSLFLSFFANICSVVFFLYFVHVTLSPKDVSDQFHMDMLFLHRKMTFLVCGPFFQIGCIVSNHLSPFHRFLVIKKVVEFLFRPSQSCLFAEPVAPFFSVSFLCIYLLMGLKFMDLFSTAKIS